MERNADGNAAARAKSFVGLNDGRFAAISRDNIERGQRGAQGGIGVSANFGEGAAFSTVAPSAS